MLKAYVNYPNSKVSMHGDPSCGEVQKMGKAGRRLVRINPQSISAELQRFSGRQYHFASKQSQNDMWIEANFGDSIFEAAVIAHIHHLIGQQYARLAKVAVLKHC